MTGSTSRVTSQNVNLTNCDREEIQFSNAVQPHAVLLVLDPITLCVIQASRNVRELVEQEAEQVLGRPVSFVTGPDTDASMKDHLERLPETGAPALLQKISFPSGMRDVFAHRTRGGFVLELESQVSDSTSRQNELYRRLHPGIASLHASSGLLEFLDRAVHLIADTSGFERVMAYRFMEDGSGEIVAEAAAEGLERFLGLHYPASDIPQPARRLFSLTWLRHLPNVNYEPSPIVPRLNPITNDLLDLSYAFSRSVSVMYTDYLRNMGVQATMVLTLLKNGTLWGLISCMNHSRPHHVSHETRGACEVLGHLVSLLMAAKEDVELSGYKQRLRDSLSKSMDSVSRSTLEEALIQGPAHLLEAMDASGAALIHDGEVAMIGSTPEPRLIRAIADELGDRLDRVWSTDRLSEESPAAAPVISIASGLLGTRLGSESADFLFWFRPEYRQTVHWAGDPTKPMEINKKEGVERLMPRGSFLTWRDEVRGRSKPWKECELAYAGDLARGIAEVMIERSRAIADLSLELARSNRELDDFVYVASHDLKEPLRGIHSYSQFLQRSATPRLSDLENSRLAAIRRLARRVDSLIDGLLEYSRTGHVELTVERVDLNRVVDQVIGTLQPRIEETGTSIRIPRALPWLVCDELQVQQLFLNLISNALKYNDKPDRTIEIGWQEEGPAFYVRDNGIGIAPRDWEAIFKIFHRLHRREEFGGGTGAGLTIVKKTVERHGGRIWLESNPGEGSTFYFTLGDGLAIQ